MADYFTPTVIQPTIPVADITPLERLFRGIAVARHNAEQIHDRLDAHIRPSVVLMNPPFSASPHIDGRFAEQPFVM